MMKVGFVVSGLLALTAVGCAAAPGARGAAKIAQADASPRVGAVRPAAPSTSTTLALGIGSAAEEHAEQARTDERAALPTACGSEGAIKDTKLCLPQRDYAKKLCGGVYPEVALGLFAKGTPWTRIYLAGDVEAWNASGGRAHPAKLAFDEEVIVLGKHGGGGEGIVMVGAQASYDVLRWDGTCVSVMEGEITTRRPPAPKPADVSFSRLEETTRDALLAAPKVKSRHDALFKACSALASPSAGAAQKKACEKADKAFSMAIVDAVRAGVASLPSPARRPWSRHHANHAVTSRASA
jgi:hypothetical protein